MAHLIHRIKKNMGFRKEWRAGIESGVVEVAKLRAAYPAAKEHKPREDK